MTFEPFNKQILISSKPTLYFLMDSEYPKRINTMLEKGQDPKDMMIEVCNHSCKAEEARLRRCETALKNMTHVEPEMTW
jgi:hypothetical protein